MSNTLPTLDFDDTAIAFERKNDKELRRTEWLFKMMNRPWLVSLGSNLTLFALKLRLPFVQTIVKNTVFQQFCGGTTLEDCVPNIDQMAKYGVKTVLDYGVEAKDNEADFDKTVEANIKSIQFGGKNGNVPIISCKVTGLARFALLEKINKKEKLSDAEQAEYQRAIQRLDKVCMEAADHKVALFIDAEESWIQDAIDDMAMEMMLKYNTKKAVIYNTFQLYRHDRLAFLKASWEKTRQHNIILGAKLVRGAYMEKERERAAQLHYPSPIQPDKAATDRDYNLALQFCIDNYATIASCCASHNQHSSTLQAEFILQNNIDKNHANLLFCQLYGMSDNLTYNLAKAGFNASKYVPYGAIREVMPYLIRRAKENSSVNGEVSRELGFIQTELARRKK